MKSKFTVRIDSKTLEKARKYATEKNTDLSRLVELYFDSLVVDGQDDDIYISPLVESLTGIISLPEDFDFKQSRSAYLARRNNL